jgi:hypothetical protein
MTNAPQPLTPQIVQQNRLNDPRMTGTPDQMQAQQLNIPQMNYQMPDFFAQPTQPNVQELTANQPIQFPQGLSDMLSMYGSGGGGGIGGMITDLVGRVAQQAGNQNAGPLSIGGGFRDFSQRGNIRER